MMNATVINKRIMRNNDKKAAWFATTTFRITYFVG